MRSLRLAVLVLLAIPTLASAQRRQRGAPDADWNELDGFARSTSPLSVKDVENLSDVKVLVDERKKLKLNDDQQKQVRAILDQEKEANKPALKTVDSLRKLARARPTAMSAEEEMRMTIARAELRTVIDSIRAQNRTRLEKGLALLDSTQQAEAAALLDEHRKESSQMLREKFAEMSRASRPSSQGGGRGRP